MEHEAYGDPESLKAHLPHEYIASLLHWYKSGLAETMYMPRLGPTCHRSVSNDEPPTRLPHHLLQQSRTLVQELVVHVVIVRVCVAIEQLLGEGHLTHERKQSTQQDDT